MSKKSPLDAIEIKKPCNESWDEMTGGETVRFCSHCARNVHNLSAMTRAEAHKLVARSNGRLCVRYVKRPDGKIQTVDRPVYRIGRRAAQLAAGVFGAALSLSATAHAQGEPVLTKPKRVAARPEKKDKKTDAAGTISGTVADAAGAGVSGAKLTLTDTRTGKIFETRSNEAGAYEFRGLAASVYRLETETAGFKKSVFTDIELAGAQNFKQDVTLEVEALMGEVVLIAAPRIELVEAALFDNEEKVRELLAAGRSVDEKDKDYFGQTALHVAAERGNSKIVRILLGAGAAVDPAADDGETPLMIAAANNNPETVRILLEAGANPRLRNKAGKTALEQTDSDEVRQLLKQFGALEK